MSLFRIYIQTYKNRQVKSFIIVEMFIKFKDLVAMINQADNLKFKQAYEKHGHFWAKILLVNFCLGPIIFYVKRIKTLTSFDFA